MKKNTIFMAMAMALFIISGSVTAWGQVSTDIEATVTVMDQLTLEVDNDIEFGAVQKNTNAPVYLDPNGAAHTNVATSAVVGKFSITGSDAEITVYWPATINLEDDADPVNQLLFTTKVVGDADDANQATAAELTEPSGSQVTIADGEFHLWVGGWLGNTDTGIDSNQENGEYSANLEFTVEYN